MGKQQTVPVSGFLIVTRRLRDCVKSRNGEGKGERHIRSAERVGGKHVTFSKITNRGIKISKEKKAVPEKTEATITIYCSLS